MNTHKIIAITICLIGFHAGNLVAGGNNTIELTNDTGVVGATMTTDMLWTDGGGGSTGFQFDIDFPNGGAFSFDSCAIAAPYNANPYFTTCQLAGGGTVVRYVIVHTGGLAIASGNLGTVSFTANGPPGVYNMNLQNVLVEFGDTDTIPAIMEILGASYNSTNPAPGDPINFGSHTAGDPNPTNTMTISNDGEPGTTLNGFCSLGGTNPGAFILSGDTPYAIPQAGPDAEITTECDSENLDPGSYSSIMSCSHDGDSNPPSPVGYVLSCEILAAPAPTLSSAPQAPGVTIDFGSHSTVDPDAMASLDITNTGNDEPLTGSCTISNSDGGVFSLAGDPVALNINLADPATTLDLTCDTSSVGEFAGALTCTHNGSNSPSTWPLACVVEPQPQYASTPGVGATIDLGDWPQNNTPTDGALTIENVGEAGSTLSGTCSMLDGSVISVVGGGAYSADVGSPAMIGLTCDTSAAQGDYSDTLSCTHNDGDEDPSSPAEYTVECGILPPDPAIYASSPYAPGDIIDVNEGNPPPPVGGTEPSTVLTISNAADPGDDFLDLQACDYSGDGAITASPGLLSTNLDPGASVDVTFTCATDTAGMFTGIYTCPFDDNPSAPPAVPGPEGGVVSPATYTVECEVRDAFSDVEESPPSGTPQTAELMPGDSHVFTFTFTETIDEGLDASLDSCTLANGTDFAITDPASFPQPIPSGGTETVDVTFTDPGVGDTFTDTLTCLYTDNVDGGEPEQTEVSWPLEVNVTGRNVTFRVTKDFSDDNPAGVQVLLECNTGLPLQQQGTVHDPDATGLGPGNFTELNFVVVDFEPGTMDCDISEVVPAGYEVSYFADIGENGVAGNVFADDDGCHYEDLESADFICEISNELLPVEVVVNKEWVDDNPGFNLPTIVDVTLRCENGEVLFGYSCGGDSCIDAFIDPNNPGIFGVLPHWDGSTVCSVTEEVDAGVLGDVSDCESIALAPGVDGECTIVNTRLFAGIPTLSQYGLLLMALLMLGIGALAFRRYV